MIADAKTKVYGDADPSLTYQVSGLKNGDSAGSILTGGLNRAAGENVGVYGINQGDLALNSGNYDLSYQGNNLTITKALLNVIADGKTKVYGDADPSLTYQVSGLKNGDTAGAVLNGGTWQRAAPLSVRAVPLRWQRLVLADARSAGLWGSGRPLARRCASGWSGVPVRDAGWGSGWEHAEQRNAAARSAWDSTRVLDVERELGWDRTLRPRDRRLSLIYNPRPSPKDAGRPPGWRRSAEFDRFRDAPWQRAAPLSVRAVPLRWQRLVLADVRSGGLWGSGRPLARRCASGWSGVPVRDAGWRSGWEHAEQRSAAAGSAWDSTRVLDVGRELGWDRTLRPRDRRLSLIYNPRPAAKDAGRPPGWRRSAEFDRFRDARRVRARRDRPGGDGRRDHLRDGAG